MVAGRPGGVQGCVWAAWAGATVMPHNLYLHSSIIQTRAYPRTPRGKRMALTYGTWDSTLSLLLAFLINAAILILCARRPARAPPCPGRMRSLRSTTAACSVAAWTSVAILSRQSLIPCCGQAAHPCHCPCFDRHYSRDEAMDLLGAAVNKIAL